MDVASQAVRRNKRMADSIERLSFELTLGAVAEQERAVSGLRTCAGTVLGAASIAGSLLSARSMGHGLDTWAVLATFSFVLCIASAIWVLLPRDFGLSFRGQSLTADGEAESSVDPAEGYRAACRWIEPQLEANGRKIARLSGCLTLGCALLATEIFLWTISLTG